jgi:FAD/FMN-containing dehydrogenase
VEKICPHFNEGGGSVSAARSIPLSALELAAAMRAAESYDASRLDRVLRVDESHGLIEVQAATPWKMIAACLRPGDARAAATATTLTTVGQSLEHNAAGPDGRPAVMHVESIAVVTLGGELRRASRTAHRELFALVAGGLGLFGALYSVTLDIGSLSAAVNNAAEPELRGVRAQALRLLVPPEKLEAFLADARGRCEQWRMPLAGIEIRRTLQENDSFLRWARRDYAAVALHLAPPAVLGAAVRATQLRRGLIDAAIAHGGSFAVSCTPEATRAQAEACYPQLAQFLAEKRRMDPCERVVNGWYRHYQRLLSGRDCAVRFAN